MRAPRSSFLFPGQGSQFKGMGGEALFHRLPALVEKADRTLGYSIRSLCLSDPQEQLTSTQYTQPAMYVVDVLTYLDRLASGDGLPDFVAGHSLGEYAALCVAGVFDFATGLMLVQRRGQAMQAAMGGGMIAILRLDQKTIRSFLADPGLTALDIANLNAPDQTILAGPPEALARGTAVFEAAGAMVVPLNVSAAFHSRYMAEASARFADALTRVALRSPKLPVISNVTARPYPADPAAIRELLLKQMTSPVKWSETISYLLAQGVEDFLEIGPGNVLTNLVTSIRRAPDALDVAPAPLPARAVDPASPVRTSRPRQLSLGSRSFLDVYGVKQAYVAGSMYMGIASKDLVVRMARSGHLAFFGTGGIDLATIDRTIRTINSELPRDAPFGMNLLSDPVDPDFELDTVRLFHEREVRFVEASGFMQITPALVLHRAAGLHRPASGAIESRHRIIAKVSHPDVARAFLEPSPRVILERLIADKRITAQQAELAARVPVATDLCVEADSGGHTDRAVTTTILPTIVRLRDAMCAAHHYSERIHVGAAGGIGTPEAVAAVFLLGADFVLTGSINQCTVEAGTSDLVKDMLQRVNVQDTDYAPAGDLFELGSKVRVMKRGVFFPARANKLYDLWRVHPSLDDIDEKDKAAIQDKYFKRSFADVYDDVRRHHEARAPGELLKADSNPKHKMALIFKSYFAYSTRWAIDGDASNRVNFQVQCGPALGAFNQWVTGTELEPWRGRHADHIAQRLMTGAVDLMAQHFDRLAERSTTGWS